jgi:hypothetical protein
MAIGLLAVGTSLALGVNVKPIQHITSFLVPKESVPMAVSLDGKPLPFENADDGVTVPGRAHHTAPAAPSCRPRAAPKCRWRLWRGRAAVTKEICSTSP